MHFFKDKLYEKKQQIKKKRKKNFHIYLDNELYMSFQDAYSRYQHFQTNKFKKISEGHDVYFLSSKEYDETIPTATSTETTKETDEDIRDDKTT